MSLSLVRSTAVGLEIARTVFESSMLPPPDGRQEHEFVSRQSS